MQPNARVYVAGHRGLAGSALMRSLASEGYRNLISQSHAELELTDQAAVRTFFEKEKPEYVFVAAAKVGGILANNDYPAEFIQSNLAVQTNVIHEAWRNGVKRLLFLGSSCIYPRDCPSRSRKSICSPARWSSPTAPTPSQRSPASRCAAATTASTARAAWPRCRPISTDRGQLRPCRRARAPGAAAQDARGEGPRARARDYLGHGLAAPGIPLQRRHGRRLRDADESSDEKFDEVLRGPNDFPLINIGCGEDQTIAELARAVASIVDFRGARIRSEQARRDAAQAARRGAAQALGWSPRVDLKTGIAAAYKDFLAREGGPAAAKIRGAISEAKT